MILKEAKERFLSTDLYMTMKKRMKQKNSETIEMLLKFTEMKEARKVFFQMIFTKDDNLGFLHCFSSLK